MAAVYPIASSEVAEISQRWAASELSTFLQQIYPGQKFPVVNSAPQSGDYILLTSDHDTEIIKTHVKPGEIDQAGEFVVKHVRIGKQQVGLICGNNSRGVLDGVYAFLGQKLGCGFYLYRNASETADRGAFSFEKWDINGHPLFGERVCFNWYNFISGVTSWNLVDYKHWIRQAARMRHTDVMLHSYGWGPFLQFTHNGVTKQVGYLQNTAHGNHWGNANTQDVRKLIGGETLTDEGPVFGADVSKVGHGGITEQNRVAAAKAMLKEVIDYAVNTVGVEFNWAFDIDTTFSNPQNIIITLPESARFKVGTNWLARPDTREGYLFFRKIIETTIKDYPAITKITIWSRPHPNTGAGGLTTAIKPGELPAEWMSTYQAAPEEAKKAFGPGHLYHAKVALAFRRALNELGDKHVKLGYGSWWMESRYHENFFASNHFMPREMTCYALDYHMAFGNKQSYRDAIKKVATCRPLVIIEWAQHDDGGYLGRPYAPPVDFATILRETGAAGYGVIHWMTRPLDIFFKSLENQVWSNTRNEPLRHTCEKMALDFFGKSQSGVMAEYLYAWMTTAPQFGRETRDNLGNPGPGGSVKNYDERAKACDKRIEILDRADTEQFSERARQAWKYFRGHEEWIKLFHLAQKDWDRNLQEKTIRKYVEKASHDGGMTRGEKGILIQHNLKWLKK